MIPKNPDSTREEFQRQIDSTGVLVFYSNYGQHEVNISLRGDSNIEKVGEAIRAFLLATGFSESTVAQILDLP